jgi:Na+:H+ antiporter, NhaA family
MKTKSEATLSHLMMPDPERDHIFGKPEGEVMLLEYGDYECPYCAEAHDAVMQLAELLGDRLCYAYRHFPLINKHPNAVSAAMVAEAAAEKGEFWEVHELLFENQTSLDELETLLEAGGFDYERMMKAVKSGKYKERVTEDREMGLQAGVEGTPTIFINGQIYEGDFDPEEMLEQIGE